MRVIRRQIGFGMALAALLLAPSLFAQNPDRMTPEENEAKGRLILRQLIEGLGGQLYLDMKSLQCDGRRAAFGHSGDTTGFISFKSSWLYPDKLRVDFAKKGNIVDIFAGNEGWTLDRGGVSEEPATAVTDFQEALLRDINYLLRYRLKQEGLQIRYAGSSVVDLKQIEWVEVADSEGRTFRIAVDISTHLPVRSIVTIRDENTREVREEVTVYTNFQNKDGVRLPMQISRERDGRRVQQTFYEACQINPVYPPDWFTPASLDKRYSEVGGKKKK